MKRKKKVNNCKYQISIFFTISFLNSHTSAHALMSKKRQVESSEPVPKAWNQKKKRGKEKEKRGKEKLEERGVKDGRREKEREEKGKEKRG